MVGLLDIAPASEEVEVAGQKISVFAINARGIAQLLKKFPELRMMLTGKEVADENLVEMFPNAISAIIAAGLGEAGNAEVEQRADQLGLTDQAAIIAAIWRQTFPKGLDPFVKELERMGLLGDGGVFGKTPVSKSQQPLKHLSDKASQ